jgi:hypothetical protein
MSRLNLRGQRIGYLSVLGLAHCASRWYCRCDCGREKAIRTDHLRSGAAISCGCGGLPAQERFWRKVRLRPGCWEWTGTVNQNGYGLFWLGSHRQAHRVAYEWSYGPIPHGQVVCHRCDNPICVRPRHLFAGSLSDNARDMVQKGRALFQTRPERISRHEEHYCAKLTMEGAREIRAAHASGERVHELARRFGVHRNTISQVLRGDTWREDFAQDRAS